MAAARLLIVDDHEIIREGVRALIASRADWEVCGEARTGREAVRMAAELRPDVVVMDLLMPDLNGIDAARQMKKEAPSMEILILSGHEEAGLIQQALEAGVRAYIFKSQASVHLAPAIAALLAGQTYLTAGTQTTAGSGEGGMGDDRPEPVLTAREREIIQWLAGGQSNKEIAAGLGISVKTVETHRASIMRKVGIESLSELVRYALRKRIIEA